MSDTLLFIWYCGTKEERPPGEVERAFVVDPSEEAGRARLEAKYGVAADGWIFRKEGREGSTAEQFTSGNSRWQADQNVKGQLAEYGVAVCFEEQAPVRPPKRSANDLYALKPIRFDYEFWALHSHVDKEVPEYEFDTDRFDSARLNDGIRVEVRILADPFIDGERCQTLASVWFDGQPVMITQSGGRGGKDHEARYITDRQRFLDMITYLRTFLRPQATEAGDIIDPTIPMRELTEFYGWDVFSNP